MEKLVYLLPATTSAAVGEAVRAQARHLAEQTRGLSLLTPRVDPGTPRSPFSAAIEVWLACLDRRGPLEQGLTRLGASFDAYLVTESTLRQGAGPLSQSAEATSVVIHQAPRLGQEEFRVHLTSRVSPHLERRATSDRIVRDSVVRPLDVNSPPLRALFTFVHGARAEGADLAEAFDALCTAEQRAVLVVNRQIVRPRASR